MEIRKTPLTGLIEIVPRVFEDERGYFFESYNEKNLREAGITIPFVQDNQSKSAKNVLRGLHFQNPPHAQAKLIRVITGAVLDVAVDIRKDSPTYGQYHAVELTAANKKAVLIPTGFAHGFVTLEDDTIFTYKCSDFYHPESEGGIRWDDPNLNIDWGVNSPILTAKDRKHPFLKDLNSLF